MSLFFILHGWILSRQTSYFYHTVQIWSVIWNCTKLDFWIILFVYFPDGPLPLLSSFPSWIEGGRQERVRLDRNTVFSSSSLSPTPNAKDMSYKDLTLAIIFSVLSSNWHVNDVKSCCWQAVPIWACHFTFQNIRSLIYSTEQQVLTWLPKYHGRVIQDRASESPCKAGDSP